MKTIQSVSIWANGALKNASILNAYSINVTLNQSATFYYALLSENMEKLAEGNLSMTGEDYQNWTTDEVAWNFIASSLNLTITGDYAPKVDTNESI